MRGSGTDGLQALCWQRALSPAVQLVRPLLSITRGETAAFCQTAGLKVWEDVTNQDHQYARNRIRVELLPYLKTHFNPQVEQMLSQTAELLQADVAYLETATDDLWQVVVNIAEQSQPTQAASIVQDNPAIHRTNGDLRPIETGRLQHACGDVLV